MKSEKLRNTLLALIFLALAANVAVPLLRANEASAAGRDSRIPADVAANAALPALDRLGADVSKALSEIADSNRQIASAIRDNAKSSEHIANSLQDVANQVKGIEIKVAIPPSRGVLAPGISPEEREEVNPDWWKNYIEE